MLWIFSDLINDNIEYWIWFVFLWEKGYICRYFDIKLIYCKEGGVVFKYMIMFEIIVYEVSERKLYFFNMYKNVIEIN